MQMIHNYSAELLESPGIYIDHDGFLDALEAKGADIDRSKRIARIPPDITNQAARSVSDKPGLIRSEPNNVQQCMAAKIKETLEKPYQFAFGGSALEMITDDGHAIRPANYKDLEEVTRFGNGHPRIGSIGGPPILTPILLDPGQHLW